MAQPSPEPAQPSPEPAQPSPEPAQRSTEQVVHERAMAEVSDVLLNLEHTLNRARKARKRLGTTGAEHNARLALDEVVGALDHARRRLQKDAYFGGDELRLI